MFYSLSVLFYVLLARSAFFIEIFYFILEVHDLLYKRSAGEMSGRLATQEPSGASSGGTSYGFVNFLLRLPPAFRLHKHKLRGECKATKVFQTSKDNKAQKQLYDTLYSGEILRSSDKELSFHERSRKVLFLLPRYGLRLHVLTGHFVLYLLSP